MKKSVNKALSKVSIDAAWEIERQTPTSAARQPRKEPYTVPGATPKPGSLYSTHPVRPFQLKPGDHIVYDDTNGVNHFKIRDQFTSNRRGGFPDWVIDVSKREMADMGKVVPDGEKGRRVALFLQYVNNEGEYSKVFKGTDLIDRLDED